MSDDLVRDLRNEAAVDEREGATRQRPYWLDAPPQADADALLRELTRLRNEVDEFNKLSAKQYAAGLSATEEHALYMIKLRSKDGTRTAEEKAAWTAARAYLAAKDAS